MSVIGNKRSPESTSASINEKGEREYATVWRVETDDDLDNGEKVLRYALTSGNMPGMFSAYAFGNDRDYGAFLKGVRPERVQGSFRLWDVHLTYGPLPAKERTEDNEPTDDPLKYRDRIEVGWVKLSIPVETAKYIGGMRDEVIRKKGQIGAVVNSAGNVYDPPLEIERSLMSLRITKNHKEFPTKLSQDYAEAVNSQTFTINKPKYGFRLTVPKWAAKCEGLTGSFQAQNDVTFWEVSYDLLIDFQPAPQTSWQSSSAAGPSGLRASGWRREVLDRGFSKRAQPGDVDDFGNILSSTDFNNRRVPKIRLKDMNDEPLADPARLDGMGRPLNEHKGDKDVYLHYQIYLNERPFTFLKL